MYASSATVVAATWLGRGWTDGQTLTNTIKRDMTNAGSSRFAVFTTYYSLNMNPFDGYFLQWIETAARAIGSQNTVAILVLEADAFAGRGALSLLDQGIGLIKKNAPNAAVFLDIGHSAWLGAEDVASKAKGFANYDLIDGWASNVSNYQPDANEAAYAARLCAVTGKPTIVDTSRNGLGRVPSVIHNPPRSEWAPGKTTPFLPPQPCGVVLSYYNKPSNESD